MAVLAALLPLLTLACGGQPADPVAGLTVATPQVVLSYPGEAEVDVTWNPTVALEDPIVFVHLWDREGRLLRTFDHAYPGEWTAGQEHTYGIELWQSVLGPPLPSGNYELAIGVTADGKRPPLDVLGAEIDRGEYVIARVQVPAPDGVAPRLEFGEGWKPPGEDTDRQVLGGRWLQKSGRLNVRGVGDPLDVAMSLRIPAPDELPQMLVLDEGVETPSVRVSSPCAPVTRTVDGFGVHRVVMPLAAAEADDCPIALATDFSYLDPVTLDRISLHLMRVEWAPSAAGALVSPATPDAADPADETPDAVEPAASR